MSFCAIRTASTEREVSDYLNWHESVMHRPDVDTKKMAAIACEAAIFSCAIMP